MRADAVFVNRKTHSNPRRRVVARRGSFVWSDVIFLIVVRSTWLERARSGRRRTLARAMAAASRVALVFAVLSLAASSASTADVVASESEKAAPRRRWRLRRDVPGRLRDVLRRALRGRELGRARVAPPADANGVRERKVPAVRRGALRHVRAHARRVVLPRRVARGFALPGRSLRRARAVPAVGVSRSRRPGARRHAPGDREGRRRPRRRRSPRRGGIPPRVRRRLLRGARARLALGAAAAERCRALALDSSSPLLRRRRRRRGGGRGRRRGERDGLARGDVVEGRPRGVRAKGRVRSAALARAGAGALALAVVAERSTERTRTRATPPPARRRGEGAGKKNNRRPRRPPRRSCAEAPLRVTRGIIRATTTTRRLANGRAGTARSVGDGVGARRRRTRRRATSRRARGGFSRGRLALHVSAA